MDESTVAIAADYIIAYTIRITFAITTATKYLQANVIAAKFGYRCRRTI